MAGVFQDVRYGARLLWRSPWFTLVAVASLALGLGAGVGLFTVMNAVLFRPLPGQGTADIQVIHTSNGDGTPGSSSSFADFESFTRSDRGIFAGSCATARVTANITSASASFALPGAVMSGGCFDLLKLRPNPGMGRMLNRSDEMPTGQAPAILISFSLWRRGFGGDPLVVGRSVSVNGTPAVIVGVAEAGFAGLSLDRGADFWVPPSLAPVLLAPQILTDRRDRRFAVYVRLADGVTRSRAVDQLSALAANLRIEDPAAWTETTGSTRTVTIDSELSSRFAGSPGAAQEVFTATIGAILGLALMACVNLATMVTARGAARTRELGIRLALGASRVRLLRQLATESLLISVAGIASGLFVVAAGLRIFDAYRPTGLPAVNLALDWRVGVCAVAMALIAPVFFGVAPGAHALRLAIAEGLKGHAVAVRRRYLRAGPRELLLVVQVVISFALFIMAALFMQSLRPVETERAALGAGVVAVAPVDLNVAAITDADRGAFVTRLIEAANRVPGVDGATIAGIVPMTGSFITTRGRAADRPDATAITIDANLVAPGYFEIAGIAQRTGRTFDAGDRAGSPQVAIVSESLARRLWDTTAVVGRSIQIERTDDPIGPTEIVGVVADAPYRTLTSTPQPVIYVPLAQRPRQRFVLHAHVPNDPAVLNAMGRALRDVDPRIVVEAAMPLGQFLDQARTEGRVAEAIGATAGTIQLGLALMALWGLVAYSVERRTAEFGIRRAIGATEASIVRLVMRPSIWLLVVGGFAGTAAGIAVTQALHSSFTGLAPLDLTIVVPAVLVLAVVLTAAAWLPARRAASIEPASALRL